MTESFFLFFPFLFGLIPYLADKNLYFDHTLETYILGLIIFSLCRNRNFFRVFFVGAILSMGISFVGGFCLIYAAFCVHLGFLAIRGGQFQGRKISAFAIGISFCALIHLPSIPPIMRDLFFSLAPFFCGMAMLNRYPVVWLGLGCIGFYNVYLLHALAKMAPAEELVFQQALKKVFEVNEALASFPSPRTLHQISSGNASSRIIFPLLRSPLNAEAERVTVSGEWVHVLTRLRSSYEIFYLFKRHKMFWFVGFKDLKDWRDVLNHSDNSDSLSGILDSLIIHSQVLGYLDFVEPILVRKKLDSWVAGFTLNEFSPSVYWFYSRLHKNKLEMELRSLKPDHSFFSAAMQEKAINTLFDAGHWEIGRSLLYRLTGEHLNRPQYTYLLARLALGLGDFPGALRFAKEASEFDPKFKNILFEALRQWEIHYKGPPLFNVDSLIKLSKELYEDSGRSELSWLWYSLEYQGKKIKSLTSDTTDNPWNDPCGTCSNTKP